MLFISFPSQGKWLLSCQALPLLTPTEMAVLAAKGGVFGNATRDRGLGGLGVMVKQECLGNWEDGINAKNSDGLHLTLLVVSEIFFALHC